jgi:hypothetical protein
MFYVWELPVVRQYQVSKKEAVKIKWLRFVFQLKTHSKQSTTKNTATSRSLQTLFCEEGEGSIALLQGSKASLVCPSNKTIVVPK